MAKHGDVELNGLLEDSAPPPDISRVSIFRSAIAKHEKQAGFNTDTDEADHFGKRFTVPCFGVNG